MLIAAGARVRLRAVALWCAVTAAVGGIALVAVPVVATGWPLLDDGGSFTDLLVTGCAAATSAAAGWLWLITTDVVVGLFRADRGVRRPGPVRLRLLAACGAVVIGATAAPASADDHRPVAPVSLSGLPLPDRATGGGVPPAGHPAVVRVRPGDSLWSIAEASLGPRATVAEVVDRWQRIYSRNATLIGPDPDLILPGQLLELPPT